MGAATLNTPSTSNSYLPQSASIAYNDQKRPFQTTSAASRAPATQKAKSSRPNITAPALRQSRAARLQKTRRVVPTLPAPGQRKAERKRIVLSNTNALPIRGLEDLTSDNMTNWANVGQVLGLDQPLLDRLRGLESFRRTQSWKWFNRPATLIRPETVEIAEKIKLVTQNENHGKTFRTIFSGGCGTGKSLMLLQAQAMALMNGWVVISIPEAQDFVNNHSSYSPLANTSPQAYTQPQLLSALLKRTITANEKVLSQLSLSQEHPRFPVPLQENISLQQLCALGANDTALAFHAWRAFWREITNPEAQRPPVLFTVDSLNHWMLNSAYHDPSYKPIHAHQLQLISLIISLLFNAPPVSAFDPATSIQNPAALEPPTLPHGGLVLAALSGSNIPSTPSLSFLLSYLSARDNDQTPTRRFQQPAAGPRDVPLGLPFSQPYLQPDPYYVHDPRVMNLIRYGTGERTESLKHPTGEPSRAENPAVDKKDSPEPASSTAELAADALATKEQNEKGSQPSSDLQVKELKGLTKDESRALLEYVARSGLLRRKVDEAFVSEMWALSGGGRAGELVRGGLRIGVF
ncbi:MAG: hypothetical protein Q9160_006491 [Pyrenula sp. 1 TL-2023]